MKKFLTPVFSCLMVIFFSYSCVFATAAEAASNRRSMQKPPVTISQNRVGQDMLFLSQTISDTGNNTVLGRQGKLLLESGNYDLNSRGHTLTNTEISGFVLMPAVSGSSASEYLSNAKAQVSGNVSTIAQAIRSYLTANNLAEAYYTYAQNIKIAGKAKVLTWYLQVDDQGNPTYGDPQIFDQNPDYIYAVYTPLNVAQGLPTAWAYPDGGLLKYVIIDKDFNYKSAWQSVQTNGAYDPPNDMSGTVDPDTNLKCLINHNGTGCVRTYLDLHTIIDQTGVAAAILDYTRTLQPVYDQGSDGATYARVSLSVDTREYSYNDCKGSGIYHNTGRYGYTLNKATDRYFVQPDDSYNLINSYNAQSISPTQAYDKTTSTITYAPAAISAYVINPATNNDELIAVASLAGSTVYVAPVSLTTSGTTLASGSIWDKDGADHVVYRISCVPGGNSIIFSTYAYGGLGACVGWQSATLTSPAQTAEFITRPHWNGRCRKVKVSTTQQQCNASICSMRADAASYVQTISYPNVMGW